jgi:hypothetical protein
LKIPAARVFWEEMAAFTFAGRFVSMLHLIGTSGDVEGGTVARFAIGVRLLIITK